MQINILSLIILNGEMMKIDILSYMIILNWNNYSLLF